MQVGEIIEGKVESIAFGGEGILRHLGKVVFVPFTAIGEVIECRITEAKRSFARGELTRVKAASVDRIQPRCPYFGKCGGCQLQHLKTDAQLKYKQEAVSDALKRIGGVSFPPFTFFPASLNWAYRRHITLHLRPCENGFEAGYVSEDHRSIVIIQECPIFIDSSDLMISLLQRLLRGLPNPAGEDGRLTILKNHREQYILFFQLGPQFNIKQELFQMALQQNPVLAGIIVQTPLRKVILGDPHSEFAIDGLTFRYSAQTFVQNHPEQSSRIYSQICDIAKGYDQTEILDLYCGFGVTSLLLGKHGRTVTGIESNPYAIQLARQNAEANELQHVQFILGEVERRLPEWQKKHQARLIIVNPPRQGLSKSVVNSLLKAKAQTLIYVSCMPSTLARDLKILSQAYRITAGYVYDMFPQTAHVETLVHLEMKS